MNLRAFIVKRLLQAGVSIWAVATLLFLMFRLLPGSPTATVISPALKPETQQQLKEAYGLAKPLHEQYILYLQNLVAFDWGISFQTKEPVVSVLIPKLVNTLVLMVPVMISALMLGVVIGTISGWYRDSDFDVTAVVTAFVARSLPVFFGGMILLLIFAFHLSWLPAGRMHSSSFQATGIIDTYFNGDFAKHALLPYLAGVFYYVAPPFLLMRNTMLEVLGEPFLEVLKAKGVTERNRMFKHAARNSLLPVVTISSLMIGYAVGGQVLLERVFSWPGMGQKIVDAVQRQDYPVAQSALLLMASIVILLNLVADILYTYLDPRVGYDDE